MKKILLSMLAVFLIFEEWLWDGLTVFGQLLVRWLNLGGVEQWLCQASPNKALAAFSIPLLIVMPINFVAIELFIHGLVLQGILLELLAKLLGTVLIARVFALTKPQLLTFPLLQLIYTTVNRWLQWAHQKVIGTSAYQWAKLLQSQLKTQFAVGFANWLAKRRD